MHVSFDSVTFSSPSFPSSSSSSYAYLSLDDMLKKRDEVRRKATIHPVVQLELGLLSEEERALRKRSCSGGIYPSDWE